jgi:hypothetical protein
LPVGAFLNRNIFRKTGFFLLQPRFFFSGPQRPLPDDPTAEEQGARVQELPDDPHHGKRNSQGNPRSPRKEVHFKRCSTYFDETTFYRFLILQKLALVSHILGMKILQHVPGYVYMSFQTEV